VENKKRQHHTDKQDIWWIRECCSKEEYEMWFSVWESGRGDFNDTFYI